MVYSPLKKVGVGLFTGLGIGAGIIIVVVSMQQHTKIGSDIDSNTPYSAPGSSNEGNDGMDNTRVNNRSGSGRGSRGANITNGQEVNPQSQRLNFTKPTPGNGGGSIQKKILWPKGRYRNLVFSETIIDRDITYKSTFHTTFDTNTNGNYSLVDNTASPTTLKLNIYQPKGDRETRRPLIIFVYGGGWIIGDRYQQESAAIDFARRGYVTMTIDYTMLPPGNELNPVPDPDGEVYPRVIYKSATNIYDAYLWARSNSETYRIDTKRIGIAGWSAGGMISQAFVHANITPRPDGVKAVLGTSNILPAYLMSAPPITGYRTFSGPYSPISMFASYQDDTGFAGTYNDHEEDCEYLNTIGHTCLTVTYPGEGHDLYFNSAPAETDALDFLAKYLAGH